MYAALPAHIARYAALTPAEAQLVAGHFASQTAPRKAYLLEAGQQCRPATLCCKAACGCMGGRVWGTGQALLEESVLDPRTGRWTTPNLAKSLVPTNADIHDLEAILIEEDDTRGHPLGVKGLGEIGLAGTAAAVANAICHATGQRLASLPMRLDALLAAEAA